VDGAGERVRHGTTEGWAQPQKRERIRYGTETDCVREF